MTRQGYGWATRVSQLPRCQFWGCSLHARVDGKTKNGPWGYMCMDHFNEIGIGLGVGRGQLLFTEDEEIPPLTKWVMMGDKMREGYQNTPFGRPCAGCGKVLETEADFAQHFLLKQPEYANLGECPDKVRKATS